MSLDPLTHVYSAERAGNVDGVAAFHDAALLKAEVAHHKVEKRKKPDRIVFAWGFHHKTKEEEIEAFFAKFGEIRSLTLVRDVVTRISKGYAFVHFARSKEARRACENADGGILAGRPVRCQLKVGGVMMGWRPRRLGGGFGGRKESGQMRFGGVANPFSKKRVTEKPVDETKEAQCKRKARDKTSHEGGVIKASDRGREDRRERNESRRK